MDNCCTHPACFASPDMFECHNDCSKCPYWTAFTSENTTYWTEQNKNA